MNYEEAMKYIQNTAKFGSNLGLERTEKILDLLGNPHKEIKCIHVAGTNGKGSTTAMITEMLKEAGFKVGMYISPYIEQFEERIQINGVYISKEELSNVVTTVSEAVDKVVELGFDHPTEFEIITCAMFLYFYNQKVDYAVIEVGLGGRLDSTNVIMPILSVITSISYDHMHILGDTLGKIAFEKAGIIKPEVPLVLYPQEAESFEVIEKAAQEKKAPLIKVSKDCARYIASKTKNSKLQRLKIKTQNNEYNAELSLLGKHQLLNCATAIYAAEELIKLGVKLSKADIVNSLKHVEWPGRLEIMEKEPLVIIDGAHNIDGITSLTDSVDTYFEYDKMILILGILADKQVEEMVKKIVPKAHKIIAVTPHSERAEEGEKLKAVIEKYNRSCIAIESYEEAYLKALTYCEKKDLLLISGSLYMIGDMRRIIRNNHK